MGILPGGIKIGDLDNADGALDIGGFSAYINGDIPIPGVGCWNPGRKLFEVPAIVFKGFLGLVIGEVQIRCQHDIASVGTMDLNDISME